MNWKLDYAKQREDGLYEARFGEPEGLFFVELSSSLERAIEKTKRKIIENGDREATFTTKL